MGDTFDRPAHRCVTPKDMSDYKEFPIGGGMVHKTAQIGEACTISGRVDAGAIIGIGCHIQGKVCQDAQIGKNVVIPAMGVISQGTRVPENTTKEQVRDHYLCDSMA